MRRLCGVWSCAPDTQARSLVVHVSGFSFLVTGDSVRSCCVALREASHWRSPTGQHDPTPACHFVSTNPRVSGKVIPSARSPHPTGRKKTALANRSWGRTELLPPRGDWLRPGERSDRGSIRCLCGGQLAGEL